ncbi:MAG: N-6 DNA methylase, partial [Candidatus Lokiarchaeota archaeon]
MGITEDSINSSIFLELKNLGLNIKTQVTTKIHGKTYKPDFYIQNDLKIYGEGEWQKSVATGLSQAATYLDDPSVDASFTIIYSNDLERVIKALSDEEDLHEILRTQIFHIYYKKKNEPSAHKRVKYNDLKSFFKEILHKEVPYKPDIDIFIETINLLANEIFKLLPEVNRDTLKLYQNILGSQDDLNSPNVDFDIIARNAAGYLFINQLIFYAILANKRADFSHINVNNLHSLSDLKNYFIKVINLDFKPVFSIDVISQFQEESLEKVKEIIRSIQFLGPEYIKSDVIGRIFHKLIPSNVRKKVAAYYTKPESAELLAFLAIKDYKINVLDPACGSGQLLIASYKRIKQLYEINTAEIFNEKIHANILENQLTGIDIMPFSAHLSLINLTLQNLNFITNQLRIAIYDSSKLTKDKEITPLQAFLRQVQKSITQYLKTNKRDTKNRKKVEKLIGSITLDGKAGTSFSIKDIDLVIMNPPFTRQELINKLSSNSEKQYKKRLIANITKGPYKRYQDYLNEKQSFSSYFLFLADKILDDRGIIASVLPVTILRDKVNMGLRKFLLNNYSLMFVIIRYDTLNFSDDTTFREILFIAKKGIPKKDHIVTYISLNRLYSGIGSDIKYQEEFILGEGIYDCKNFTVEKVAQSSLNSSNLFGPIALKSPDLLKIWQEALRSKIFTKKTRSLKANEGARSRKYGLVPEMCIVEELDSRTKFKFIDITSRNSHKNIEFESIGHIKYNIWQQNTFYYCRSASHKTMNIGSLNEFVIHK